MSVIEPFSAHHQADIVVKRQPQPDYNRASDVVQKALFQKESRPEADPDDHNMHKHTSLETEFCKENIRRDPCD